MFIFYLKFERSFFLNFFMRYRLANSGTLIFFLICFLMDVGTDAILLGAETLRGLYPIETISIVGKICAEVKLSQQFSINPFT